MGKSGGNSGGGGASGRIEYPPYMTNIHSYILTGTDLSGTVDRKPYNLANFGSNSLMKKLEDGLSGTFDQNGPVAKVVKHSEFEIADDDSSRYSLVNPASYVDDPSGMADTPGHVLGDWQSSVDALGTTTDLDDKQDSFEIDTEDAHLRAINRFSSQMADINAVNSSAFIVGMALMESARQRQITQFRSEMAYRDRYFEIESRKALLAGTLEYQKTRLVADVDYLDQRINYLHKNQLWDMELYKYASNALAGIAGAVSGDNVSPSRLQSALGGTLMGAGVGAMAGTYMGGAAAWTSGLAGAGPIGLGIGALAGLVYGLLS